MDDVYYKAALVLEPSACKSVFGSSDPLQGTPNSLNTYNQSIFKPKLLDFLSLLEKSKDISQCSFVLQPQVQFLEYAFPLLRSPIWLEGISESIVAELASMPFTKTAKIAVFGVFIDVSGHPVPAQYNGNFNQAPTTSSQNILHTIIYEPIPDFASRFVDDPISDFILPAIGPFGKRQLVPDIVYKSSIIRVQTDASNAFKTRDVIRSNGLFQSQSTSELKIWDGQQGIVMEKESVPYDSYVLHKSELVTDNPFTLTSHAYVQPVRLSQISQCITDYNSLPLFDNVNKLRFIKGSHIGYSLMIFAHIVDSHRPNGSFHVLHWRPSPDYLGQTPYFSDAGCKILFDAWSPGVTPISFKLATSVFTALDGDQNNMCPTITFGELPHFEVGQCLIQRVSHSDAVHASLNYDRDLHVTPLSFYTKPFQNSLQSLLPCIPKYHQVRNRMYCYFKQEPWAPILLMGLLKSMTNSECAQVRWVRNGSPDFWCIQNQFADDDNEGHWLMFDSTNQPYRVSITHWPSIILYSSVVNEFDTPIYSV